MNWAKTIGIDCQDSGKEELIINIYDIAKMSGVSIATVSRVVNGSPKVSEKTKQKVLSIIDEAGYTPNVFARGLGLDSMKTIGILCPDISDTYMAEAVSYLEKHLNEHGYDCILGCSGYDQKDKEKYTRLLLSKRIDTLVMVGSTYAGSGGEARETAYIREAAAQTPVFLINGYVEGDNIYCAYADDFKASYDVTTAFIRRGKKRILFLCNSHSFSANQKLAGYEAALADAGYPVLGELKFYTKNQIHNARDMLLQYKNLEFDAVLATEDGMAIAALKYAKVKGISIPEELAIVGCNNSQLAICCEPELTSVDNKRETLCSLTVEQMIALLEKKETPEQNIKVPCDIVKRCTTDF